VKAAQAAAAAFGVKLDARVARVVVQAVSMVIPAIFLLLSIVVVGGIGSGGVNFDGDLETSTSIYDNEELFPKEVLRAYQRAARGYDVPWTLIAALGTYTTEHGRFSPYDTCDRRPGTASIRYGEPSPNPDSAECDGITPSSFPTATPEIGTQAAGEGVGPFLILPSALPDGLDAQSLDASSGSGSPDTATEFIASEMDRIREDLVSNQGWENPAEFSGSDDEISAYAERFWSEVLSRLPVVDGLTAACQTPLVAASQTEVSAAITTVWRCELQRADLLYTIYPTADPATPHTPLRGEAVDLIVNEALSVAWGFSQYGTENTAQSFCGRLPIAAPVSFNGTTEVLALGDESLTASQTQLKTFLTDRGVPASQIRVDAAPSRSAAQLVNRVNALDPTTGVVVVMLGRADLTRTTTWLTTQVNAVLEAVPAAAQVVWLTVDDPAAVTINTALTGLDATNERLTVLDWSGYRAANPGWVGTTPGSYTEEGNTALAAFVADNLPGATATNGRAPLVGGRTPTSDEPRPSATPGTEPLGVFPLTSQIFDAYNPVTGASRCDLGANIHAAVLAFIAGEKVEPGSREGSRGSIGDRSSSDEKPWAPVVGGWRSMPWALGTEITLFEQQGPRQPFTPSSECRVAVLTWVAALGVNDIFAGTTFSSAAAAEPSFAEILAANPSPVGLEACAGRNDGSIEALAASIASSQTVQTVQDDTVGDPGLDAAPPEVVDGFDPVGSATPLPVETDPSTAPVTTPAQPVQQSSNFAGLAAYLTWKAAQNPLSSIAAPAPGSDVIIPRLSATGRRLTGVPRPALTRTPFSSDTIRLAQAYGGVVGDDPKFDPDSDPFEIARSRFASASGSVASLAGVPPALLEAVNLAVDAATTLFPACTIDAAFLLATAKAESGSYWDRIGANGTMVPALENSATAQGPFQFIRTTWPSYASDGNGDGVSDPQNTYDSALASMKMQCGLAAAYGGDLTSDAAAWEVAVDYHDGPAHSTAQTQTCRDTGEHLKSPAQAAPGCRGEAYATRRVEFAKEFRALISQSLFSPQSVVFADIPVGNDLAGRAVQYALSQVGKLYCSDHSAEQRVKCPVQPTSQLRRQYAQTASGLVATSNGSGTLRFGPDAYDCSGFVAASYMKAGFDIGQYVSANQYANLPKVPVTDLRPGDLVFFDFDGGGIDHVEMYVGGGKVVHAAGTRWGVVYSDFSLNSFVGASRPSSLPNAPRT
jgi:hypothetical protein